MPLRRAWQCTLLPVAPTSLCQGQRGGRYSDPCDEVCAWGKGMGRGMQGAQRHSTDTHAECSGGADRSRGDSAACRGRMRGIIGEGQVTHNCDAWCRAKRKVIASKATHIADFVRQLARESEGVACQAELLEMYTKARDSQHGCHVGRYGAQHGCHAGHAVFSAWRCTPLRGREARQGGIAA